MFLMRPPAHSSNYCPQVIEVTPSLRLDRQCVVAIQKHQSSITIHTLAGPLNVEVGYDQTIEQLWADALDHIGWPEPMFTQPIQDPA